jgi:hypothetical protein
VKGEEIEITVRDNGKGMPQEIADKLAEGREIETTKKEGHVNRYATGNKDYKSNERSAKDRDKREYRHKTYIYISKTRGSRYTNLIQKLIPELKKI